MRAFSLVPCAFAASILLIFGVLLNPLSNAQAEDNAVLRWDSVMLRAVSETKFGPPMTARAIGITHTCMYDAWAAYDAEAVGTQFLGALRRPSSESTDANKQKAISYAAYRALVDLFPSKKSLFDGLMTEYGFNPSDTTLDSSLPQGIGNVACQAVLNMRHKDGSNQLGDLHSGAYSDYTGYVARNTFDTINDLNSWVPLRVSDGLGGFKIQNYLAPHWGNVTPFALDAGADVRPKSPYRYFPDPKSIAQRRSNTLFRFQALEVLRYSAQLDDRKKTIAEYWADGPASVTPPGHWCLFGQFVSHRDSHSLDQDVKLFFALGNAEMDAGIAAWDSKRAYDSVRPISAIQELYRGKIIRAWAGPGQGTRSIAGENWQPYQALTFVTPAFPEHVSGHSTFSAAGATILRLFTGSDRMNASVTLAAGSSPFEPGITPREPVTLRWNTFREASDQAGISRLYGGIHFQKANLDGRRIGTEIGKRVWAKSLTYFNGTAK